MMNPSAVAPVSDAVAAVLVDAADDVGRLGREDVRVVASRVGQNRLDLALRCHTRP